MYSFIFKILEIFKYTESEHNRSGCFMKSLILIFVCLFLILPISFAEEIRVFLQSADNETLDDTFTSTDDNINYGTAATWRFFSGGIDRERAWITYNMLSVLDQCSSINGANFSALATDFGVSSTSKIFEVNTSSARGAWDEEVITGQNNSCGTSAYNNGSVCNQTEASSITVDANTWFNWTVTSIVKKAFNENKKNVSFNINNNLLENAQVFNSKEATTAANRPILYVYCEKIAPPEVVPSYDPIAVHLNGTEIINGFKTFLNNTVFAIANFTQINVGNIFGGNFFGNKVEASNVTAGNLTVLGTLSSSRVEANNLQVNKVDTVNLTATGLIIGNLSQSSGLPISIVSQSAETLPIGKNFTSNGGIWIWWGKGTVNKTKAFPRIRLNLNGIMKDEIVTKQAAVADTLPFSLMFTEQIPAGTHTVNITTTAGNLGRLKLIGMEIR